MKKLAYVAIFLMLGIPALILFFTNVGIIYFLNSFDVKEIVSFVFLASLLCHFLERTSWFVIYRRKLEKTNLYIYFICSVVSYLVIREFILENISLVTLLILSVFNTGIFAVLNKYAEENDGENISNRF